MPMSNHPVQSAAGRIVQSENRTLSGQELCLKPTGHQPSRGPQLLFGHWLALCFGATVAAALAQRCGRFPRGMAYIDQSVPSSDPRTDCPEGLQFAASRSFTTKHSNALTGTSRPKTRSKGKIAHRGCTQFRHTAGMLRTGKSAIFNGHAAVFWSIGSAVSQVAFEVPLTGLSLSSL
jgi:hypothetical protein